jgi:hypothetical protein
MKRIALAALIFVLLAAACGDDKKNDVNAASQSDDTTTTTGVTGEQPAGGASTTTTARKNGGSGGTTTTTGPGGSVTTTTPTSDPSVTMTLDKPCVRRGPLGDKQGLGVVSAPEDTIAWSTEYSDGTNELSNPEYKSGGSGYGKAGSDGRYHTSWFVPKEAPLGEATLHTVAKGKLQPPLKFRVVGEKDSC